MPLPGSESGGYTRSAIAEVAPTRARWRRHLELAADLARQSVVDLAVPRNDRSLALRTGLPRVVPALIDLPAPVSAQVALQIAALHAAIVKCSASRSR
jgi:hypothetical protein